MALLTPNTTQTTIYSDFRTDFLNNPVTGDLALVLNENSIKQSLKNIIFTNRGERLFDPGFGCDVKRLLFENITPVTLKLIENTIYKAIEEYEPRVSLISVDVTSSVDDNNVNVSIAFYTINSQEPETLNLILKRVR